MASQLARNVRRVGKGYLPRPSPKTPADYGGLIADPAIDRWMTMRETTTKHFKWTPKTFGLIVFWAGILPTSLYYFIKEEITNNYVAAGKERPHFFPDSEMSKRRPDPLPPRKEGVKIVL
ncbi:uncharacterized protein LOC130645420 [Hydractinia symbiolongicarpus]|uniref:uncharacterized protein LOC130645420 n=1 Tax=Hydractinia symbiolongicarpus TaxID=13093 RepID=UPI00254C58DD|nr:uncharacterized protein LOC130645420 [Hydractinia symbiolongicarpus]